MAFLQDSTWEMRDSLPLLHHQAAFHLGSGWRSKEMANSLSTCGFSRACKPLCFRPQLLAFVPILAPEWPVAAEQPQGSCSGEDPRRRPLSPLTLYCFTVQKGGALSGLCAGDSQLQLLSNRRWRLPRTMLFCHKPRGQVEGRWPGIAIEAGGLEYVRNYERDRSSGNHGKARESWF